MRITRIVTLASTLLLVAACGGGGAADAPTVCAAVCEDGIRLGCSNYAGRSQAECVSDCTSSLDTPAGCFDTNLSVAACGVNKGVATSCASGNPFYEVGPNECQSKLLKALQSGCATPL